ncbi:MAG TPA: hypothetical protein VIJ82_32670 [Streptosporangiaceae bacterium]
MRLIIIALAAAAAAAAGLAACGTAPSSPAAATYSAAPPSPARSAAPAPTVTKTITSPPATPVTRPPPATTPPPAAAPDVTDPWAVVSAYYGDIESGDYPEAWALLSSGTATGQTYQQFAAGFACTGEQQLTELDETGDQVSFDLTATDDCTGANQQYTGTDTVVNGKIVAASVTQTG